MTHSGAFPRQPIASRLTSQYSYFLWFILIITSGSNNFSKTKKTHKISIKMEVDSELGEIPQGHPQQSENNNNYY